VVHQGIKVRTTREGFPLPVKPIQQDDLHLHVVEAAFEIFLIFIKNLPFLGFSLLHAGLYVSEILYNKKSLFEVRILVIL